MRLSSRKIVRLPIPTRAEFRAEGNPTAGGQARGGFPAPGGLAEETSRGPPRQRFRPANSPCWALVVGEESWVSGAVWHPTGPVLGRDGCDLECARPRLVVYGVACFAPSAHGIKDDFY